MTQTEVAPRAGLRPPAPTPLLAARDLTVSFRRRGGHGSVRVLDGVDLDVAPGEIVGVIGETGSGKTTLARALVGLVPTERGRAEVGDDDVTALRGARLREFRRSGAVQFVFQDPLRSLDPDLSVEAIVGEGLAVATRLSRAERRERVVEALRDVGLPETILGRTPGQISGGQRQRVSIARALVLRPRLLICDEPVSALDASNRNHVLRLLDDLRTRLGVGILVISHDLSSLAGVADRVVVLYRGRVVESGPIEDVFTAPRHPYTALLVASAPNIRREHRVSPGRLRRDPDAPAWPGGGCVFAARCPFAAEACHEAPDPMSTGPRTVACHFSDTWPDTLAIGSPHSTKPTTTTTRTTT